MKFKDKTRGGYDKRIYATDGGGGFPIHGAIKIASEWMAAAWTVRGKCEGENDGEDLIPLREPSEAAVEAAFNEFWAAPSKAFEDIRRALRAAYEIDFPEGGA